MAPRAARASRVQRWGHSLSLRIPAALAHQMGLVDGSEVDVRLEGGVLVVRPGAPTLESLLGIAGEKLEAPAVSRRLVSWRPGRGDLVLVGSVRSAAPGDEAVDQAGRRPALVISPAAYCSRSGLALACAVVDAGTGSPFEVPLPPESPTVGVVAADRVRVLDWRTDRLRLVCRAPDEVVSRVCERLVALVG